MRGSAVGVNNNYYHPTKPPSAKSLSSSNPSLYSEDSDEDQTDASLFAPVDENDEFDSDPEKESEKEPESWSELVDKKVQRRMGAKDIKRQDVIYELIQTESQYVKTLQIMKRVYHDGMRKELNFDPDILAAMFPCLEDLLKLNGDFYRDMKLEQDHGVNFVVDRIGNIILKHFGGDNGIRFRKCYGEFCSRHIEAVALYKAFMKNDPPFNQFMKNRLLSARTGRRDIPEIITYVSIRMTKYPLLIEAIIKATKETSPDFTDLKESLNAVKEILVGVDDDVEAHDKEKELVLLMKAVDSKHFVEIKNEAIKSAPCLCRTNKLFPKNSRLLYDKKVMLKSKNKFYDTRMVILTSKIIFFQENGGKLQLLNVDNKMPVLSLKGVMYRENAAEPKNIFLMNRSDQLDEKYEMYEIIFEKHKDKPELLPKLDKWISNCPDDEEEQDFDAEEEARKEQEERLKRLKDLVDQLEHANQEIRSHFDTKNRIVQQLIEITDEDGCPKAHSPDTPTDSRKVDVFNTRMQLEDFLMEVNAVIHASTTSSVTTPTTPDSCGLPSDITTQNNQNTARKSDTFGGFDNRHKMLSSASRSTSHRQLPRNMSEPDVSTTKRRQSQLMSVLGRMKMMGSSEDLHLSASSLSNFVPPSLAEMQVYQHLSEGLESLLAVTNQQDAAIERMRQQLHESRTLQSRAENELVELRERLQQQQRENEKQLRVERENYAKLAKEYKRTKEKSIKLADQQRHMQHMGANTSEEMIV